MPHSLGIVAAACIKQNGPPVTCLGTDVRTGCERYQPGTTFGVSAEQSGVIRLFLTFCAGIHCDGFCSNLNPQASRDQGRSYDLMLSVNRISLSPRLHRTSLFTSVRLVRTLERREFSGRHGGRRESARTAATGNRRAGYPWHARGCITASCSARELAMSAKNLEHTSGNRFCTTFAQHPPHCSALPSASSSAISSKTCHQIQRTCHQIRNRCHWIRSLCHQILNPCHQIWI